MFSKMTLPALPGAQYSFPALSLQRASDEPSHNAAHTSRPLAIAYARTASRRYGALEEQLNEVLNAAGQRGVPVAATALDDRPGYTFWHPGLFHALGCIRRGQANVLAVHSLHRLHYRRWVLFAVLLFLQNHNAALLTTHSDLRYELFLRGLEYPLLNRAARRGCGVPWKL